MQNKDPIDNILEKRDLERTNLDALNSKIMELTKETQQHNKETEFETKLVSVNNSAKIITIAACFVLGMFTGFSLSVDATSNDFVEYVYIEEGII